MAADGHGGGFHGGGFHGGGFHGGVAGMVGVGTGADGMAAVGAAADGQARLSLAVWLPALCLAAHIMAVRRLWLCYGGCTSYAPIYDAYGNYIGQQPV